MKVEKIKSIVEMLDEVLDAMDEINDNEEIEKIYVAIRNQKDELEEIKEEK
jgi:Zn-finger domain-containing protein